MMLPHRFKLFFALLWGAFFVAFLLFWHRSGLPLAGIPAFLHERLGDLGLFGAAVIYIFLYAIRPLVLFPATLLTIASGLIFGPWLGILFTIIGENASANFAFFLARWLGRDWVSRHEHGAILRWEEKIRKNALLSVLVMRLIYLPFDAVNYGCGLTSMRQRDYFIGTFLGILPGLISFVLLGGAVSATVDNRLFIFAMALVFFVLGLIIASCLHKARPDVPDNRR